MSKLYPISHIQFHNSIMMQGVTLGDKVTAVQRNAQIFLDLEFQTVWITFKGKTSGIPTPSVKAYDLVEVPEHVQAALTLVEAPPEPAQGPAYAIQLQGQAAEYSDDDMSPEAHRARVRAASANANKPNPLAVQNDLLIQEARQQASGIRTAQVSNPTQPKQGQGVTSKPKAISHAQLKAQIAQEMKS